MGIKRLNQFLRYDFTTAHISDFHGLKLGVDISSWIYQAYFCQLEFSGDDSILILRNIELKLKLFEQNDIKAIFVFDGHSLDCKQITSEKRGKKRDYYMSKVEEGQFNRLRR